MKIEIYHEIGDFVRVLPKSGRITEHDKYLFYEITDYQEAEIASPAYYGVGPGGL